MWTEYITYKRNEGYYIPDTPILIITGPAGTAEQVAGYINRREVWGYDVEPIPNLWHLPRHDWVDRWISIRNKARADGNMRLADVVRRGFSKRGITLRDTKDGTEWCPHIVEKQTVENARALKQWDAWVTATMRRMK